MASDRFERTGFASRSSVYRKAIRSIAARLIGPLPALALLAACGGGSGGDVISTPPPPTNPPPTNPPATPTPTPAASFDTAEYRRSHGPDQHNAIAAWQRGASGKGVGLAIIDTGIDTDSPEFAGRISPASADVAGARGIDGSDGHGTHVALVAAAARNDSGIMGIAFDATILAFRADMPGTCTGFDPANADTGCVFNDADIAKGVNLAVAAGARVVNISLGGSAPSRQLNAALVAAAAAGAVIVVSAGNDGDGADPARNPANPDAFATGALQAGGANLIIAGSVDENAQMSSFSNKAGSAAASYLVARGEKICCVYKDGAFYTETRDGSDFVYLMNGTSFAAPQIAGAAALLAQAFPNLTGAQIVQLLLKNARDVGAAGIDEVYGRGVLDIGAAFAPSGVTTLAGSGMAIPLASPTGTTSPAMGDAGTKGAAGAIILDGYERAYAVDLMDRMRQAAPRRDFALALQSHGRGASLQAGALGASFTIADPVRGTGHGGALQLPEQDAARAQVLAAQVSARIAPGTTAAFGFRQGASGLEAGLRGADRPAFMVAQDAGTDLGFAAMRDGAMAIRREFGAPGAGWGLTLTGESGTVWSDRIEDELAILPQRKNRIARYGVAADMATGPVDMALGASWMAEDSTLLGGSFHPSLVGGGGADSLFVDAAVRWKVASDWHVGGAIRHGYTRPHRGGLMARGAPLRAMGWHLDAVRHGVFGKTDRIAFRIAQPLRVESGALALNLPVDYDYASETASIAVSRLSLSPSGREIASELAWQGPLWGGSMSASLFHRRDPGHIAAMKDDLGAGLRWSRAF